MPNPDAAPPMIPQGYPLWLIREDYERDGTTTYLARTACHLVIGWAAGTDPEEKHDWFPVIVHEGGFATVDSGKELGSQLWDVYYFTTVPPVDGGRTGYGRRTPRQPPVKPGTRPPGGDEAPRAEGGT